MTHLTTITSRSVDGAVDANFQRSGSYFWHCTFVDRQKRVA
jgi:hypothetical protein